MKKMLLTLVLCLTVVSLFAEVPESTWKALYQSQVTVVKNDGSEVNGKLSLIESATVSIIKANGEVVTVRKKDVRSVKAALAQNTAAGTPDPGWAAGAAVFGYAAAGATLVFGVVTMVVNDPETYTGAIVGGIDYLIMVGSFPIVAFGDASALGGGVISVPWLRITGWIAYGLAIADGIVEIVLGAGGVYIPNGVILSTVLLGTAALCFVSTDALLAAAEATEKKKMYAAADGEGPEVAVLPLMRWHREENGSRMTPEVGLRCLISF